MNSILIRKRKIDRPDRGGRTAKPSKRDRERETRLDRIHTVGRKREREGEGQREMYKSRYICR